MKPRVRPSRRTCGKMPIRRSKSIGSQREAGEQWEGRSFFDAPLPRMTALLLDRGRRDRELLDDLVVAPLLGVVARDGQDEVLRLQAIALAVEGDLAGDPGVLDLADRSGDILAGDLLAALGEVFQGLD